MTAPAWPWYWSTPPIKRERGRRGWARFTCRACGREPVRCAFCYAHNCTSCLANGLRCTCCQRALT